MVMEFIITPHTKNIIVGRKEGRGEERELLCVAKTCLHVSKENPLFPNRKIEVKGYVKCPRCMTKVNYPENLYISVENKVVSNLICPACHNNISMKDDKGNFIVTWTQRVVSKHRHSRHDYYHGECFDTIFIDLPDEE
jgi:Zn finger protein HypA/HybF involved in hydrogenase expression